MNTQSPHNIPTPRPVWSVLDRMVGYMIDISALNGGVTTNDLVTAGFSLEEIGDHASEAATIARRRMIRHLEVA